MFTAMKTPILRFNLYEFANFTIKRDDLKSTKIYPKRNKFQNQPRNRLGDQPTKENKT
jgi:hypothetical protein